MTVRRCVSSKSNTCELMPFISAACITSIRSRRPRMVACAGPEKWGKRADRDIDACMARASDGAARPVEQGARGLLSNACRKIFGACRNHVASQAPCHILRDRGLSPAAAAAAAAIAPAAGPASAEVRRKLRRLIRLMWFGTATCPRTRRLQRPRPRPYPGLCRSRASAVPSNSKRSVNRSLMLKQLRATPERPCS
jgi:hypothetical protein